MLTTTTDQVFHVVAVITFKGLIYQIGVELKPLPEAFEDASNEVGVVEQGQRDQENVERVPHGLATLKKMNE